MTFFVHPQGICETKNVGANTRIWAFAHILAGAKIGCDCNICDQVFIENDVIVGNRVTIKCGVQLWDGIVVEDDVFIGPNATFTNDRFPRSKIYPDTFLKTIVEKKASIGANATILPGITIGQGAMVGGGSVVVKSVPPNAIVVGNPAKIIGYTDTIKSEMGMADYNKIGVHQSNVKGVTFHNLPIFDDLRGTLSVGEFAKDIPFKPLRYFLVFNVGSSEIRGEHAHKQCHQFLVCVKGTCSVIADDGNHREEFLLTAPNHAVYLPPLVWGIQYRYSPDAVLLVFASHYYDADDYIRNYNEFLNTISKTFYAASCGNLKGKA